MSDLTRGAALTLRVDASTRELLPVLSLRGVCGQIVELAALLQAGKHCRGISLFFFFYVNQSRALKCFQIGGAENIFCFIISS